jgi:hypothetical protein
MNDEQDPANPKGMRRPAPPSKTRSGLPSTTRTALPSQTKSPALPSQTKSRKHIGTIDSRVDSSRRELDTTSTLARRKGYVNSEFKRSRIIGSVLGRAAGRAASPRTRTHGASESSQQEYAVGEGNDPKGMPRPDTTGY